ncbi:enoyl-CoA hydratase [Mycobacterium xenopi 4042]|uniref:Enoyl-CoA hydratase n=1 Tax=Mycobacterium xenopi 4042 TaxID=1299334 RepID=X8AEV1_MYCXE|nr:enoyl-CoA hydratase [Mycobacterium xenopi 4042]
MDTLVEYAVDGNVARLTLNSPNNRNALSSALVSQLHQGCGTQLPTQRCAWWCSATPAARSARVRTSRRHRAATLRHRGRTRQGVGLAAARDRRVAAAGDCRHRRSRPCGRPGAGRRL